MLSYYGGWYAFLTFFTVILYIIWTINITEHQRKVRKIMNQKDAEASGKALDCLLNFETVKYFTAEDDVTKRYNNALNNYFNFSEQSQFIMSILSTGQAILTGGCLGIVLYSASQQIIQGSLTIGDLVAIHSFVLQMWSPLSKLGKSYRSLSRVNAETEQLFSLLNEPIEIKDHPSASLLKVDEGTIEFQNVSFSYIKDKIEREYILDNISFAIKGGQTLAIVGESGSGKSTIFRLLCRLYDIDSGHIYIDGQDISKVTQKSLRRAIGVVPQDTILFQESIRYNIEIGAIDNITTFEMVQQAAKEAHIDEFIMNCPGGYDCIVGQRGLRLSGGERQRISIARTILKNPPILILDEATSALDSKTEKEIQKSLFQISKGRTTIIIAHRLSTIIHADQIIVLKGGKIVEKGTHKELLEFNGEYSAMWKAQLEKS